MIKCDYHIHTNFCDGKSTPQETVDAALKLGLETIGFSGHGYTAFDGCYCMSLENNQKYIETVSALKAKYADKLNILCGVEQDCLGGMPISDFDFVIGSVHYVEKNGQLFDVDRSKSYLLNVLNEHFEGDIYAFCEAYFKSVSKVVEATGADIIGHFDLVSKFNENDCLFDSKHPRYLAAWQEAADKLITTGKPFEINTGAISRGYRSGPYPAEDMMKYIIEKGGRFIMTSDSHSAENLCYQLDKWYDWAIGLGAQFVDKIK